VIGECPIGRDFVPFSKRPRKDLKTGPNSFLSYSLGFTAKSNDGADFVGALRRGCFLFLKACPFSNISSYLPG
jgi:hypothetical protein